MKRRCQERLVHWCFAIAAAVLAVGFSVRVAEAEDDPPALVTVRADYESKFLRDIAPLQKKYSEALADHQRKFTRNGDLVAAKEAQLEIKQAKLWETVPLGKKAGARSLKNAQLAALQTSYEGAVLTAIQPLDVAYLEQLSRLKESLISANELDAAILVEEKIKTVQAGQGLPIEAGARRYLEGLTKQEFGEWLEDQVFEFTGISAGKTALKFNADKVSYGAGPDAPLHEYRLSGTRDLEINGGVEKRGLTIKFSRDLQSGVLISRRGEYEVLINPEGYEGVFP